MTDAEAAAMGLVTCRAPGCNTRALPATAQRDFDARGICSLCRDPKERAAIDEGFERGRQWFDAVDAGEVQLLPSKSKANWGWKLREIAEREKAARGPTNGTKPASNGTVSGEEWRTERGDTKR